MTNPVSTLLLVLLASGTVAVAQSDQVAGPQIPPPPPTLGTSKIDEDLSAAVRATRNNDPAEALSRYLRVLAQEPNHLEALTGAGKAALDTGDANAAATFYARADEIAPNNGRVKAGLGAAMVQLMQSRIALRLFDEALDLGGIAVYEIASDRGLAYDLRGDNRRARADYELALKVRPDAETTRRLAVTEAIAGDSLTALATLDPLLRKQDKAAWRMRAFILAIGGDLRGADEAARSVLTPAQADALKPFLARLPKLRPAQQAAAIHFGQFPSEGRTYTQEELAAASGITSPTVPVTSTLSRLQARRDAKREANAMADDQGDGVDMDQPPPRTRRNARPLDLAAVIDDAKKEQSERTDKKARADKAGNTEKTEKTEKAGKSEKVEKTGKADKAEKPGKKAENSRDKDAKDTKDAKAKEKEKAARDAKEAADAKAKDKDKDKAKDGGKKGERYWVQVATGSYKPDLGKEWAKVKGRYPALLGRYSPWTTPLNKTNRLMIGPFKSRDEAQAFVNKAAGAGFGTSPVTTSASQTVERVSN